MLDSGSRICCRKCVIQVLRELLLSDSVMHTVVSSVLARYSQLHVDGDAFVASIAEIISDIREPITVQQQELGCEERRQLDLKVSGCHGFYRSGKTVGKSQRI